MADDKSKDGPKVDMQLIDYSQDDDGDTFTWIATVK
jgi:hypothetical protein